MPSMSHFECEFCGLEMDALAIEVRHHCEKSPRAKSGKPEWLALKKLDKELKKQEDQDGLGQT